MRLNDIASTSFRRHVPTRFLINQCQIITVLILKSDIIENSRIELRGIVLPVPSNQIKVTFIITLPFNLVHLWFFPVSHRNWRKRSRWVNYWGAKGYVAPPLSNYWGGSPSCPPPLPTPVLKPVHKWSRWSDDNVFLQIASCNCGLDFEPTTLQCKLIPKLAILNNCK